MITKIQAAVITLVACCVILATIIGCTTTTQTAALQGASATDAAVRTAMIGWGAYVAVAHPSTNEELKVLQAFNDYRAAELAVIDASANLLTNTAATNLVTAAAIAEQAAQTDLISIIASLTNGVPSITVTNQ